MLPSDNFKIAKDLFGKIKKGGYKKSDFKKDFEEKLLSNLDEIWEKERPQNWQELKPGFDLDCQTKPQFDIIVTYLSLINFPVKVYRSPIKCYSISRSGKFQDMQESNHPTLYYQYKSHQSVVSQYRIDSGVGTKKDVQQVKSMEKEKSTSVKKERSTSVKKEKLITTSGDASDSDSSVKFISIKKERILVNDQDLWEQQMIMDQIQNLDSDNGNSMSQIVSVSGNIGVVSDINSNISPVASPTNVKTFEQCNTINGNKFPMDMVQLLDQERDIWEQVWCIPLFLYTFHFFCIHSTFSVYIPLFLHIFQFWAIRSYPNLHYPTDMCKW